MGAVVLLAAGLVNDRLMGGRAIVLLASFAPYAAVAVLVALVGFTLLAVTKPSRWSILGATLTLTVAAIIGRQVVPLFLADKTPSSTPTVTVLTANVLVGQGDLAGALEKGWAFHADAVVVQEVTPEAWAAVAKSDAANYFEYRVGQPQPGVTGLMVLSHRPITAASSVPVSNGGIRATIQAGPSAKNVELIALHAATPDSLDLWYRDLATVRDIAAGITGPLVVAGDFNATLDHEPMRRILDVGLADAAEACGSGWHPTWPTPGHRSVPTWWPAPVITIDHVLFSSGFTCVDTKVMDVANSDHRAVLARAY